MQGARRTHDPRVAIVSLWCGCAHVGVILVVPLVTGGVVWWEGPEIFLSKRVGRGPVGEGVHMAAVNGGCGERLEWMKLSFFS